MYTRHPLNCKWTHPVDKDGKVHKANVHLIKKPYKKNHCESEYELPHDKTNKMTVCPAKTRISLGIRPVWSESLLSAWRKLGSLATHWAHNKDSDQTGRIPRLIWVFAGCMVILLVFSWHGSYLHSPLEFHWNTEASKVQAEQPKYEPHHEKTCLWGLWPVKTQTGLLSFRS